MVPEHAELGRDLTEDVHFVFLHRFQVIFTSKILSRTVVSPRNMVVMKHSVTQPT